MPTKSALTISWDWSLMASVEGFGLKLEAMEHRGAGSVLVCLVLARTLLATHAGLDRLLDRRDAVTDVPDRTGDPAQQHLHPRSPSSRPRGARIAPSRAPSAASTDGRGCSARWCVRPWATRGAHAQARYSQYRELARDRQRQKRELDL